MDTIALYWPDGQFIRMVPEDQIRAQISRRQVTIQRTRKERRAVVLDSKFSAELESYQSTERNLDAGNFTAHYTENVGGGHELTVLKRVMKDGRMRKWRTEDPDNPRRKFDRFSRGHSLFTSRERLISRIVPPVRCHE